MSAFNATEDVRRLKLETKATRKPCYRRSRLDKYRDEIVSLKAAGATFAEIQRWLRRRRIKMDQTSISRYLKKNG